jgi:hypothetical protein
MKFTLSRTKKYIEAVQKRLNAPSKEVGKNYINFIDSSNKTIIGFYFEYSEDVYTLTDVYYDGDYYPLVQNKVISLEKMIKAVEKAEIDACIRASLEGQFADYEDSLA